ncbi:MAG: hypothetical protein Q9162_004825, partial [Coniocarpon cinnabarinum]
GLKRDDAKNFDQRIVHHPHMKHKLDELDQQQKEEDKREEEDKRRKEELRERSVAIAISADWPILRRRGTMWGG